MSEILKRPTADETDEDLIELQKSFNSQKKPSVEIHKMRKRAKNSNFAPKKNLEAGNSNSTVRFEMDLDGHAHSGILYPIRERPFQGNVEFRIEDFQKFSKDDGFPEPLDLSAYYKKGRSLIEKSGRSFFAQEFDRIQGNLEWNLDEEVEEEPMTSSEDFHVENEKILNSMDPEKILEIKDELFQRFDPKLMDFLKNRSKSTKNAPKISKFKASRLQKGAEPIGKGAELEEKKAEPIIVEEMMNELEVLEEWKDREDEEKYNRLATDAIQMDLTAKFGRNLAQRQQKNAVKLFDNAKMRPDGPPDALLDLARASIDQIKTLYLEDISLDGGATVIQEFGKGLNPILDQCWSLIPIRRVLDTVEKRGRGLTPDDVEIVRLTLLWTILLWREKKTAFFAFFQPNDFFIHLTECFLIGREILEDDVIIECIQRLLDEFIMSQAKNGRISLRMTGNVAGLDAFMPFYENLLRNYEQYSMGDTLFAKSILIAAYLNAPIGDSLEYRYALWSPKRNTIRQMTVTRTSCRDLFDEIKKQHSERIGLILEQHYVQYCSLLGVYVQAIRDDLITRDRNQLMFDIASFEIGKFMEHQKSQSAQKAKEFQILVDIIQKSIGDKLMIL